MSTGPVLIIDELNDYYELDQWSGTFWLPVSMGDIWASSYYRERPISTNNPVRDDRTRAPSAFWHRGCGAICPTGLFIGTDVNGTRVRLKGPMCAPLDYFGLNNQDVFQFDPGSVDQSMMKALLKVKDSKVNLGVALAEARKTAEMLGKSTTRIANGIDSFMSRNVKQLGRMLSWKKIPAAFLELSYGWVPLLRDVYGSCEALAEIRELGTLLSLSVTGKSKYKDRLLFNQSMSFVGIPMEHTVEVNHLYKTKLVYYLPDHLLSEFSSLGLLNPLEIVWEIVPYSFVLDWFVPVGNWLSALDAGAFLNFKEGSQSSIVRSRLVSVDLKPTGMQGVEVFDYSGKSTGFRFQRDITVPYIPMLTRTRGPLGLDKMAKGIALLTQVMKKWA